MSDPEALIAEANKHNWGDDHEDYELPYRMVALIEAQHSTITAIKELHREKVNATSGSTNPTAVLTYEKRCALDDAYWPCPTIRVIQAIGGTP